MRSSFFERRGRNVVDFFTAVHAMFMLFVNTVRALPSFWFYRRQVLEQLHVFSAKTLPIAGVIGVFIGLGTMVQAIYQSSPLVPRALTVNIIFKSITFEVCPIVLSLVLAGKLGASLAAEIGSMKISEQLEALETLSLDPVGFLVMPRVLAGVLMLPFVTIFANAIALASVFVAAAVASDWISPAEFSSGLQINLRAFELYLGNFIKPAVFGFWIALSGCAFGLKTRGGALGVGRAATKAVVTSAILIVIFDYYLIRLLL
jgi:phospholipid/cholesterol/gamma-HCH transport system permease protein